MKVDILTLKALFQKDVRYMIPTFQRPYVWNQEDQWEPLWNDVRNISEEYLEQLAAVGEDKQALAEERTGTHFMGAVVVQQQPNMASELETRHVIDGQQRLTTLQLLLDAAQEVFESDGSLKEAKLLRKLVLNDEDYADVFPDYVFKVWPTLVDQEPFRQAMSNQLSVKGFENAPIVQAHEFFKLQIREWIAVDPTIAAQRAHGLVTALIALLETVVIDLQSTDDANVIFETLNARGTPLLDSDLIKNSVLHSATQAGLNSDALYKQYWQSFDQPWWRAEVSQGRLVRPRIDVFLNYWLTMRTAAEVQSTRFFPTFRQYAENRPGGITSVVEDIHTIGKSFQHLTVLNDWSPQGEFLYRWRVMDAGVTTPVILWLFSHRDKLGDQRLVRSLKAIESYLIRRMVCRMTTKDYNKLFLELMRQLGSSDPEAADEIIIPFLASQTADARLWPDDSQIRDALLSLPLYRLLTRPRLRMVLEGLEAAFRTSKTEEMHVPRAVLTIEHIMPRGWREHWAQGVLDTQGTLDPEAAQLRDRLVHTIGNLTLLTGNMNSALSNGPWRTKRGEIAKHSVLFLNRDLLDTAQDFWDESVIRARGAKLAGLMAVVWPRPSLPSDQVYNEPTAPTDLRTVEVRQNVGQSLPMLAPQPVVQSDQMWESKSARGAPEYKQWDETSFFETLAQHRSATEVEVARTILDWAKVHMPNIWWGRGKQSGSFIPGFDHNDKWHQLIGVWTNGYVELQFQYIKSRGSLTEAQRLEILHRVNRILGTSFGDNNIDLRPGVPLAAFTKEEVLPQFLAVLEWALAKIAGNFPADYEISDRFTWKAGDIVILKRGGDDSSSDEH